MKLHKFIICGNVVHLTNAIFSVSGREHFKIVHCIHSNAFLYFQWPYFNSDVLPWFDKWSQEILLWSSYQHRPHRPPTTTAISLQHDKLVKYPQQSCCVIISHIRNNFKLGQDVKLFINHRILNCSLSTSSSDTPILNLNLVQQKGNNSDISEDFLQLGAYHWSWFFRVHFNSWSDALGYRLCSFLERLVSNYRILVFVCCIAFRWFRKCRIVKLLKFIFLYNKVEQTDVVILFVFQSY